MNERVINNKVKEECPVKVSMKKIMSIMLAGFLLMFSALPALALDEQQPVEPIAPSIPYAVIRSKSATISLSGTTASCRCKLTAQASETLTIKMTLQKKSGSTWSNVQFWSASKNGTSLTLSKTKTVASGGTYRLKVTFTAGSETVNQTVYP